MIPHLANSGYNLGLVAPHHHHSAEVACGTLALGLLQVTLSLNLLQLTNEALAAPWLPPCLASAPSSSLHSLSLSMLAFH